MFSREEFGASVGVQIDADGKVIGVVQDNSAARLERIELDLAGTDLRIAALQAAVDAAPEEGAALAIQQIHNGLAQYDPVKAVEDLRRSMRAEADRLKREGC